MCHVSNFTYAGNLYQPCHFFSSDVVNKNRMQEIMKASYRAYPNEINRIGINNLICANEEFSELQIEVSKILRGRSAIFKQDTDREQYLNDRYKLLEELADSYLAIQYIMDISAPESYGTKETQKPNKHKRYGTRVLCAECGTSKKTLYKVGELYFCRDCKKNHKDT